jgi:hypothetical protein
MLSVSVSATKRYWLGITTSWNSTANWAASTGGAGGATVPGITGSNDTCYFDGGGTGNCTIDVNINLKRFEILGGYTGTITQGSGITITVGTGGMKLAGGTFAGGSSAITINSTFDNTGCNFTSTSATFEVKEGHFYLTGNSSYLHNSGTLKLTHNGGVDTCKIDLGTSTNDTSFYNLEISSTGSGGRHFKFLSPGLLVLNDLTMSGTGTKIFYNGYIDLKGNLNISSTGSFSSNGLSGCWLRIKGTGNQYIYGQSSINAPQMLNLEINKSGTLYLSGIISTRYHISFLAGSINAGTSKVSFRDYGTGTTIKGNFTGSNSLNKLEFVSTATGAMTIDDTVRVNDSIIFAKTSQMLKGAHAGVINARGHIYFKGNVSNNGDATLLINGPGKQEIRSERIYNASTATTLLPCVIIAKDTADTLVLRGTIIAYQLWKYVSGKINSDNAKVYFPFGRIPVIVGSHSLKKVVFSADNSIGSNAITIRAGTELTVCDSLFLIGSVSDISNKIDSGIVNIKGHFVMTTTAGGFPGNAKLRFNGNGDQRWTGSTTFNNYPGKIGNVEVNKSSGTLYIRNYIHLYNNATFRTNFVHIKGDINADSSTVIVSGNVGFYNTNTTAPTKTALYNLSFQAGTITVGSADTVLVKKDLTYMNVNASARIDSGVVEVQGNVLDSNLYTSTAMIGTGTLLIDGGNTQTLRGSGTAFTGFLPKVIINKSGGALTLESTLTAGHDWEYRNGTVNASTTSKVIFTGTTTRNLDAQGTSSTMSFYDVTINGTRNLTGDIKVKNNLTINSASTLSQSTYALSFGGYSNIGTHSGTGAINLIGSGYNTFTKSGGGTTNFGTVKVERTGGSLLLASPVNITGSMTFVKGIIKTTGTNLLKFGDNATCSGGSDSGYVKGPVIKTGNDDFTFPLGDSVLSYHPYNPLTMSAPSVVTDAYTARFYPQGQTVGAGVTATTLQQVSSCSYWDLARNTGSSAVTVDVQWNAGGCEPGSDDDGDLAYWSDTTNVWRAMQPGSKADFDASTRKITSHSSTNVPFKLTNPTLIVPIQRITSNYVVLKKKLDGGFYQLEPSKRLSFKFDEEYFDKDSKLNYRIYNEQNVPLSTSLPVKPVHYGNNEYSIPISQMGLTEDLKYYTLEITNEKNEKWYLRFQAKAY